LFRNTRQEIKKGKGKMKEYKVQQLGHVWYEVIVKAESLDEARDKGIEIIMNGEGTEVYDLFTWEDEIYITEKGEN
jgi:hypothetical protein